MVVLTSLFMSLQTLRAEEMSTVPAIETQNFSKILCRVFKDNQWTDVMHGYYPDVDTVQEAQKKYPVKFSFLEKRCEGETKWVVESVAISGVVLREWNQPCTEDVQCASGSCHPDLNMCNPRFPFPISAAH